MNLKRRLFANHAPHILVVVAIVAPLLFDAASEAVRSNKNSVTDWLPKSYSETADLRWFREHFVGDQFVVVSWDGCRLGGDPSDPTAEADDPRIEQLARTLIPDEHSPELSDSNTSTTGDSESGNDGWEPLTHDSYFKSVVTARQLLDQLTRPPMNLSYEVAVRRLQGSLIGPDGHQTCVIATLSDHAINNFREVLGRNLGGFLRFSHSEGELFEKLRLCQIDPDSVHLGGPPVDNVAIDEEGERTLIRLASLSGLACLLLAWWSLRSIRLTMIVFACGLLSATASLAAVWLTGETSDAILLSMPALVYVLAMSGAIHLINYYRDAVTEHGVDGAPERAIAHGWKPALFCSVTTAFGLLSLCASELTPVRKFGLYSAIGVMTMLIVLFLFLPAALQMWAVRRGPPSRYFSRRITSKPKPKSATTAIPRFWGTFGGWIIRHHALVTAACVAVTIVIGFGITRVHTSIDLMRLFDPHARILRDYKWLEANVGRLVPMEIVLRFDPGTLRPHDDKSDDNSRFSLLERMEVVSQVQRAMAAQFGPSGQDAIGPSMSAATFVPPIPKKRRGMSGLVRRTAINSSLEQSYSELLNSGYLRIEPKTGIELWRISVRVAAFQDVDYGKFANELRSVVDPIVANTNRVFADRAASPRDLVTTGSEQQQSLQPAVSAVYTGVVPIVYKAQRALLDSLIESTVWSFLTITPLLMFVSRGVRAGIVAMLPNFLPVLVIFGGMGWLGRRVDIGSMMSASIALGVAVDDTIHYLTWFREELNRTGDRRGAILFAYQRCATPTLQAALINGFGLSIFAFSTFTPTRQFGFLMLSILLAGAVAELVMLPALLAGPLGNAFQPRKGSPHDRGHDSADDKASRVAGPMHRRSTSVEATHTS